MASEYAIEFTRAATRDLDKLRRESPIMRSRIDAKVDGLTKDPRPPASRILVGGNGERRIRVGRWRIVYRVDDSSLRVTVLLVQPRGRAYAVAERRLGRRGT